MSFTEASATETTFITLSVDDQQELLSLARESIRVRLLLERDLLIDETAFSPALQQQATSFVTLRKKGQLRGCIGSTQITESLVTNVVHHAMASAIDDPRFPPVTLDEESALHIEISVLSTPTLLTFADEKELLAQLSSKRDGLTIEVGANKATFLPDVWNSMKDETEFLSQLKLKADLATDFWSDNLKAWNYQTYCFSE